MGAHIIDGKFQSDKYPTTPRGKVPLSVNDKTAQELLWEYAQRRREVDAEFSADLEECLRAAGYSPCAKADADLKIRTTSTWFSGETDDGASIEVTVTVRAEDKEDALGLISEARRRLKTELNGEAQFCSGALRWSTRHL